MCERSLWGIQFTSYIHCECLLFQGKNKEGMVILAAWQEALDQWWVPRGRKLLEPSSKDRCKVFALIKGEVFAHLKCSRFKDGGRSRIGFLLDAGLFRLSQRFFLRQKSSLTLLTAYSSRWKAIDFAINVTIYHAKFRLNNILTW